MSTSPSEADGAPGTAAGSAATPLPLRALRWVLISIAATHVPTGLALMFSHSAQVELAALYGASFEWTVRDIYLVRILGSSIVVIGTLAASAARDPARNPVAIVALAEFFLLRNLQRHLYAAELYQGFGVDQIANVATSVLFFVVVGALWLLYPKSET